MAARRGARREAQVCAVSTRAVVGVFIGSGAFNTCRDGTAAARTTLLTLCRPFSAAITYRDAPLLPSSPLRSAADIDELDDDAGVEEVDDDLKKRTLPKRTKVVSCYSGIRSVCMLAVGRGQLQPWQQAARASSDARLRWHFPPCARRHRFDYSLRRTRRTWPPQTTQWPRTKSQNKSHASARPQSPRLTTGSRLARVRGRMVLGPTNSTLMPMRGSMARPMRRPHVARRASALGLRPPPRRRRLMLRQRQRQTQLSLTQPRHLPRRQPCPRQGPRAARHGGRRVARLRLPLPLRTLPVWTTHLHLHLHLPRLQLQGDPRVYPRAVAARVALAPRRVPATTQKVAAQRTLTCRARPRSIPLQ